MKVFKATAELNRLTLSISRIMADSEGFAQPWLDVRTLRSLSKISTKLSFQFEKQIGTRLLLHGPIDQVNKQFEYIGSVLVSHLTFPPVDTSVKTEDKEISPGLKVRIYTPPNHSGNRPVCIFYHGGGWAMGDLDGEDAQVRTISKATGVVIVSVDYRLAPAHPYPAPLDDCVTAYYWALKSYSSLGTMPNEAFTFGTSAGGNLALSTALRVIDAGNGDTLKGVVAVVPVTIAPEAVSETLKQKYTSYEEHSEHTINTGLGMKTFFGQFWLMNFLETSNLPSRCLQCGPARSIRLPSFT
jgi:versiconal hemiacetal acetate esterase